MRPEALLETLHAEGAALLEIVPGRLDQPVPHCPGWDVAALLAHTSGIYRWVTAVVDTGERQPVGDDAPAGDVIDGYAGSLAALEATLAATDPDRPVWNFGASKDLTARWWFRRQALETAVHRWDATVATSGEPDPASWLEADLAVDGIDEYLADFLPRLLRRPVDGIAGTLHLHCTDTDGEWLIDLSAERPTPERTHAKADTALRGPASSLLLWLWNRTDVDAGRLDVFGGEQVVDAWPSIRP